MKSLLFLLIVVGSPVQGIPVLEPGMSMKEVLTVSGPPVEKRIRESRRIEEWKFPAYTVVFKEGNLISWSGMVEPEPEIIPHETLDPEGPTKSLIASSRDTEISTEASNIIEEILREVPSGGDSPGSSGGGMQPSVNNPIPPAVVNPGEPIEDDE